MHEVYAAPKGHWENIYVDFPPFGMGEWDFGRGFFGKNGLHMGRSNAVFRSTGKRRSEESVSGGQGSASEVDAE